MGTLFVVATPIGNLEDISMRALRVLREAAVIAAEDTRHTARLLSRYAIETPTTSLHEHNETRKSAAILERLRRGESVALVSDAGTPGVSDPGQHLIREAIAAGFRVEPVPGPNAAISALVASGFPTDSFTFLGFPPTRSYDRKRWFERAREVGGTVVFYEAPHRICETLEQFSLVVGDVPVVLGRELTKAHEEFIRGSVAEVLASLDEPRGEFTIVANIGQTTESRASDEPISDAELLVEFGQITEINRLPRRQAINKLARRHQRTPNDIYDAIERAKKIG